MPKLIKGGTIAIQVQTKQAKYPIKVFTELDTADFSGLLIFVGGYLVILFFCFGFELIITLMYQDISPSLEGFLNKFLLV